MMDIQAFVDFMEGRFGAQIAARSVLEESRGQFADFPAELDPKLAAALREGGLRQLYSHQ